MLIVVVNQEMESLFSLYKDDIPDEQYEEYLQILECAESAVLQQADIILCTCVTSAQLNITSATNIIQVCLLYSSSLWHAMICFIIVCTYNK